MLKSDARRIQGDVNVTIQIYQTFVESPEFKDIPTEEDVRREEAKAEDTAIEIDSDKPIESEEVVILNEIKKQVAKLVSDDDKGVKINAIV